MHQALWMNVLWANNTTDGAVMSDFANLMDHMQ